MDDEWLRPRAMQNLLFEYRPDLENTLVTDVQEKLAYGFVRARAKIALLRTKRSLSEVRAGVDPHETEARDWPIPAEVWRCSLEQGRFALPSMDRFDRGGPILNYESVRLVGLSFNRADILEAFEIKPSADASSALHDDAAPGSVGNVPIKGVLPHSAKPRHFRCENVAHQVAELLRSDRTLDRAKAIAHIVKGAKDDLGAGTADSKARMVRETFDLMYDSRGNPHQN